nr:glutaredoxin protein family-like [Oryza sativa Japonica Group]BAD12949.1 glutaredoxin protein family-like [Oryza sativa Japonica Group]
MPPRSLTLSRLPVAALGLPFSSCSPPPPRLRFPFAARRARSLATRASSSSPDSSFGSRMEDSVKRTLADNPVVIYSKSWCSGVQPHVIELDQLGAQGPQLQKVLERLTGQSTVPNVFIGGKHIGGCTDTVKLHRKGELATMLSELDIDVNNS